MSVKVLSSDSHLFYPISGSDAQKYEHMLRRKDIPATRALLSYVNSQFKVGSIHLAGGVVKSWLKGEYGQYDDIDLLAVTPHQEALLEAVRFFNKEKSFTQKGFTFNVRPRFIRAYVGLEGIENFVVTPVSYCGQNISHRASNDRLVRPQPSDRANFDLSFTSQVVFDSSHTLTLL